MLSAQVAAVIADPAVHTLVFRGRGKHFCTGFDLSGLEAETDATLRERFVAGLSVLREMFAGFVTKSAADAGIETSPEDARHFANVSVGLSFGLGLIRVVDREQISPALLGTALSVLIRGIERDPELRADMADPDARRE